MKIQHLVAVCAFAVSATSHAGVIEGGSTLVNGAGLSQLETWLGQGPLTLTNVFTKGADDTATTFHAAADGKGATFSLMRASEDNGVTWKTIGGYNPISWNASSGYNISTADWTSFIFNLTDNVFKTQSNQYGAVNVSNYGPTFGGGHDIYVRSDLSSGYSNGFSYGGYTYQSIVDGSQYDGVNMMIGALEVFTIAEGTDVPEPATAALLGLGLFGLLASRHRKNRAA